MADIVRTVARYRDRLARHQDSVTHDVVQVYSRSLEKLERDLRRLEGELALKRRRGEPISQASLERERRYQQLILTVKQELLNNARHVAALLDAREEQVVDRALVDADRIVSELTGTEKEQHTRATLLQVIAATSKSAPVRTLLEDRAGEKAEQVRQALLDSILRGNTPAQTTRRMREAYGGALKNALTIARTETARAQREASRLAWLRDPQVTGWWWQSQCTADTCSFCWGQHGTIHTLSEPMATHPNCRCLMLPITADSDHGPTGVELFDRLPRKKKLAILGYSKLAAFEAGELSLPALVGRRRHPVWGQSGFELSLTQILGAEGAAAFYERNQAA